MQLHPVDGGTSTASAYTMAQLDALNEAVGRTTGGLEVFHHGGEAEGNYYFLQKLDKALCLIVPSKHNSVMKTGAIKQAEFASVLGYLNKQGYFILPNAHYFQEDMVGFFEGKTRAMRGEKAQEVDESFHEFSASLKAAFECPEIQVRTVSDKVKKVVLAAAGVQKAVEAFTAVGRELGVI